MHQLVVLTLRLLLGCTRLRDARGRVTPGNPRRSADTAAVSRVSLCVSWVARINVAKEMSFSLGPYVTVVRAISEIFCTPRSALFVIW